MLQFLSRVRYFTFSSNVPNSTKRFSFLTDDEFLLSNRELKAELCPEIKQPENPHFLKLAILGEPNVGKSSLINCLMPLTVFPTSHVMHTTYKKSTGIMTHGNVQVAFLDTPGIVTVREARNKNVERTVLSDPLASVQEADMLLVLFDIANKYNVMSLHPVVLKLLRKHDFIPAILVINKMDKVKYQRNVLKQLDSIVKSYHKLSADKEGTEQAAPNQKLPQRFKDTFFVSSYTGQGIISLKEYLLNTASPGLWQYPGGMTNDMDISEIITEFIRAELLSHYYKEVPHVVVQTNEELEIREDGSVFIKQVILCPYRSVIQRMLVSEGKVLGSVRSKAAEQLSLTFQRDVELEIELRVHKFKK